MSTAPAKPRSLFGHQLRAALKKQGVSTRELARRMHRAKPAKWDSPSSARRSVARWIAGANASSENRSEVAVALELPRDHFGSAADDEEEAELYATLTDALIALVRREVQRERTP